MQARIHKWGNSLAIRIPESFAGEIGIQSGSLVDISVQSGNLVVAPLSSLWRLEELLAQVTPENTHSEQSICPSFGRESWE